MEHSSELKCFHEEAKHLHNQICVFGEITGRVVGVVQDDLDISYIVRTLDYSQPEVWVSSLNNYIILVNHDGYDQIDRIFTLAGATKTALFLIKTEVEYTKEKYATKQVIVVNSSLRNYQGNKLRTGKWSSQVAHASLAAYKTADRNSKSFKEWDTGSFAKITLQVESQEELITLAENARATGLNVSIIIDSGRTEFDGNLTFTCIGIGPHWSTEIDSITGHLKPF